MLIILTKVALVQLNGEVALFDVASWVYAMALTLNYALCICGDVGGPPAWVSCRGSSYRSVGGRVVIVFFEVEPRALLALPMVDGNNET
jgi:hypothetical protein